MHAIAIIAFEGISPFHLPVPCMVFGDDPARLGVTRYRLLICAEKPGLISTLSGFKIQVDHGLDALEQADTIMPAWRDPEETASPTLRGCVWAPSCWRARACWMGEPPPPIGPGVAISRDAFHRSGWTASPCIWTTARSSRRPAAR